jgi:putative inorganic carbon (HCO3(-)) transporter
VWLLAVVLVASPGALSPDLAVKQDVLLAVGILLALTTAAACVGVEDVRKVIGFLLVVGLGLSAYGLRSISGLRASFGGAVVANRAQGIFAHPNDLGAFAAIVCMVGIGSVFGARTRAVRIGSLIVVVVNLAALLVSLSRGAWIGTLLAAVVMLYLLPQARRALVVVGIPLVLAAVLAGAFRSSSPTVVVVRERLSTLSSPTNNPYDDRPSIWREAAREIRADPWTGQGPGNFPVASARSASLSATVGAVHAHDVLLTVAAEAGLPAALLVVCFTVGVGLTVRRVARLLPERADRALLAGIGCGLVANVGQGLVDFNLRNPVLFLLLWSLVGLVLVGRRELLSARPVEIS